MAGMYGREKYDEIVKSRTGPRTRAQYLTEYGVEHTEDLPSILGKDLQSVLLSIQRRHRTKLLILYGRPTQILLTLTSY